jgi:hypothetical protein
MEKEKSSQSENASVHLEETPSDDLRRESTASTNMQSQAPVWELRRTYTKSGIAGLFASRYVFTCALLATLGGLLFGYDEGVVSITLVMPQFLHDFPEVSANASGAGFKKGLMTAVLELGAFIGNLVLQTLVSLEYN